MRRKHIDDVQPATVKEHYDLILKEESLINHEPHNITPEDLPDWYDEKLFKIHQSLYARNIISFVIGVLVGFIGLFAVPSISKVLWYVKGSHTPCLAYKRYYQTLLYMHHVYLADLQNSDDKFYKYINTIRYKHTFNSNKARNGNGEGIYQRDMVLTQVAAIGYIFVMPEVFGLRIKPEEEMAMIHVWRVMGRMLEIPDRINVCRKDVAETRELFLMLIDKFSAHLNNPSPEYNELTNALLDGLWYGNIGINKEAFLMFIYQLNNVKHKISLRWYNWIILKCYKFIFRLLLIPYIGPVTKIIFNKTILITLYFAQNLPLIAWMSFGRKKSQLIL
ncbi:uncharacterized protein LOC116851596 [Odontomachus brunneus]|uniref:uncharacterized protein LOC116851596 n=1 Tax=Odontomachus brunneus TaxID=486640 RepID=UPI0013F252E7|nr:uncharacterized protein LOC116851596 [Odontomachus brunneus]XP_032687055.1 uncharacterized protein LOC116851596 [Odontomachus brunneus]XP_032687056.1 uncharacterized protein LOC116851596 [Odontomachus brunneus]XP_032687057.1 uncharacterized protein LOC116851596 [Odontomachus brunneus]XP_032687058.1 uncharacterized protein LOC116851596 [Odontomachus brunneus]XP_032687059.1 uncharacterized protein LOC116851596 [Odontomachus brunneus]XP_032687060.1 uncharacterized protein LOC116851596 [Odonto